MSDSTHCPPAVRRRAGTIACVLLLLLATACGDGEEDATSDDSGGREESVAIAAEDLELAGTLRLPDADGPHPGVVIAHGSGPQSRRGLVPGQLGLTLPEPVPVYEELAEGLQDAGYAVLTFDKRSCGPFNGCAENGYPAPSSEPSFQTFVDDVGAALDYLAARDDIDEMVLVGHSQGGTIAAELAADRNDLAAAVLLSTPAVPIDEVVATQVETLRHLVEVAGQTGTAVAQAVSELQTLSEDVDAIAAGDVAGEPVGGASRQFWASWITASRAATDHVRAAQTPVAVIGGENDWNVPPEHVEAWQPFLGVDDSLRILPEITHALTRLEADDPAAITPADVGTKVDPSVLGAITDECTRILGEAAD